MFPNHTKYFVVFNAEMGDSMSLTVNTAALTGGVGGILGLIIVIQSVVIVILIYILKKRAQSKYANISVLLY